jgi:hypothetical protein
MKSLPYKSTIEPHLLNYRTTFFILLMHPLSSGPAQRQQDRTARVSPFSVIQCRHPSPAQAVARVPTRAHVVLSGGRYWPNVNHTEKKSQRSRECQTSFFQVVPPTITLSGAFLKAFEVFNTIILGRMPRQVLETKNGNIGSSKLEW